MVKSGQEEIRPVDFGSRLHARLPVEVIERHELLDQQLHVRLPAEHIRWIDPVSENVLSG